MSRSKHIENTPETFSLLLQQKNSNGSSSSSPSHSNTSSVEGGGRNGFGFGNGGEAVHDYGSLPAPNTPVKIGGLEQQQSSSSSWYSGSLHAHTNKVRESLINLSMRMADLVAEHVGSIGMLGSISIAVNSLTGPAMLSLPATFARSGIIPTSIALTLVCILSALCCLHMANTISKVPPFNSDFHQEVEFSQAFEWFGGGRKWFLVTQFLFFGCITCLNISSIVDTSQVVDTFFGHWCPFGAIALKVGFSSTSSASSSFTYEWLQWDYSVCSDEDLQRGTCLPFQNTYASTDNNNDDGVLFSIGDVVATLVFLPLALLDLKENSVAQIVGFLILLITSVQFVIQFAMQDSTSWENLSWWGSSWYDLLGVVLFNFCLVIVIPAWLYEREPHVSVSSVVCGSSALSLVLYLAIGILGSTLPNVSDNMLESLMSGSMGVTMELGASLFAFAIIGLGIPLFSVLTRLNLMASGLVSRSTSNVLAVYLPFGLAYVLDNGHAVTKLLSWGGIVFTGLVVFVLPLLLAIRAVTYSDQVGSVPVYFGYWPSRKAQLYSLYGLITITTGAIVVAMVGLILQQPNDIPSREEIPS